MNIMYIIRVMYTIPIIQKLGGRRELFPKLRQLTDKWTTEDALRMWEMRLSIPGSAYPYLMQIADSEGVAYTPTDFIPSPHGEGEEARNGS